MYFVIKPRGYGKCYEEYKEVIDYYEKEIARLNKTIERLIDYNELIYKRYDRKIKEYPVRSVARHNLEIIKN